MSEKKLKEVHSELPRFAYPKTSRLQVKKISDEYKTNRLQKKTSQSRCLHEKVSNVNYKESLNQNQNFGEKTKLSKNSGQTFWKYRPRKKFRNKKTKLIF